MALTTYTTSGTLTLASQKTIQVSCWGAGGDGNPNGTGGSGGAYATKSFTVPAGTYTVNVGTANADGFGNGGVSNFISASVILVQASGGKSNGSIAHQASLNTGSVKFVGGAGGTFAGGYGNYGGAAGGAAGGGLGAGAAGGTTTDSGASFPEFGHTLVGSTGASGATSGGGSGGNAAYYDAGPNSRLIPASNGVYPGGGGGGGYSGETNSAIKTEGIGGGGRVDVIVP